MADSKQYANRVTLVSVENNTAFSSNGARLGNWNAWIRTNLLHKMYTAEL